MLVRTISLSLSLSPRPVLPKSILEPTAATVYTALIQRISATLRATVAAGTATTPTPASSVCVCVCACACVYACMRVCVCVCLCLCELRINYKHLSTIILYILLLHFNYPHVYTPFCLVYYSRY